MPGLIGVTPSSTAPDNACSIRSRSPSPLPTWAIIDSVDVNTKADFSRITVIPGQRSGEPCIRGLRVTVGDVLDMLASGMTEDEILRDYPYLEKVDFPAVYAYASQMGRKRISR